MKMSHIVDPVKEAGFTEWCGSLERRVSANTVAPALCKAGTQRTATALRPTGLLHSTKLCLRTQDLQRPRVSGTDWQIPGRQTWREATLHNKGGEFPRRWVGFYLTLLT